TLGGSGVGGKNVGHVTRVKAAVYDPATLTVTLFMAQRLDLHNQYRLTVNGMTPSGITGASGTPLAGQGRGPGTSCIPEFNGKLLAGPASTSQAAARKRSAVHRVQSEHPSAAGVDALSALDRLIAQTRSNRLRARAQDRRA